MPFTEEAFARGVVYNISSFAPFRFGSGLAFADLDNDGDADLVTLGAGNNVVGLFENDGTGNFTNRIVGAGLPTMPASSGVIAADYDADGDLDLYFSNYLTANVLARNDGGFTFTDVSAAAGVADLGAGTGCAWGDYNNDGWLDLFVGNRTLFDDDLIPNRVYRNNADGTFTDVAAALGLDDGDDPTFQVICFDADNDADMDVYLSTDKGLECKTTGITNHLFQNDAGVFTDITDISGTAACLNSMGVAVGDFDGNGFQDLYCTNTTQGNKLFLNQDGVVFADETALTGTGSYLTGWGAAFIDIENDMKPELFVCSIGPNRLYRDAGGWPCVDIAAAVNVADAGNSFAVATADIDLDGDIDIAMQNTSGNTRLYINHDGATRNWLRVTLVGEGANLRAVGAQVRARTGATWQLREVIAGNNYKSQNELPLLFGFDAHPQVDELIVTWPGGSQRTLLDVAAGQHMRIYPPTSIGDLNCDGGVGVGDIGGFVLALTDPAGYNSSFNGNCSLWNADTNNDGRITVGDIGSFVAMLTGG